MHNFYFTKVNNKFKKIWDKAIAAWNYCTQGVWEDTRSTFKVVVVKTLNITAKSFLSTDIQTQACAMTYRTMLAIVPALALLFAIGRGFGFQNLLQDELYKMLPSQREAITHALEFVDSYLNQASEGIFVGVGLVFLLWTLISLISSVEDSFNLIWGVKQGRSMWRKISDYTAMFLILPVLMICGSGFSIFVSNTFANLFDFPLLTPVFSVLFEFASYLFTCMFFAAVFMLIPNTKVAIKNALIAGALTGTAFLILQWLFVSGQLYVSKYNAIYGSFSFLPLLLLWLQLVWVICFTGCLICYASQNIVQFSFDDQIQDISRDYRDQVMMAIATVVVQNFTHQRPPITKEQITRNYGIPPRLLSSIVDKLSNVGVISIVVIDEKHGILGLQPAIEPSILTLAFVRTKIHDEGSKDFIPYFDKNFPGVIESIENINAAVTKATENTLLQDIDINININPNINI